MRTGSWHPKLSTRTLRKRFPFSACNLRWVSQWLTLGRRACDGFILLESAITSTTVSEVVKFRCYQSGIPPGAVDQPCSFGQHDAEPGVAQDAPNSVIYIANYVPARL